MKLGQLILMGPLVLAGCMAATSDDLSGVHQSIQSRFQDISHISAVEFSKLDRDEVIVFDTRPEAEYAVSQIPGALQINPDISGDAFLTRYSSDIDGKKVVFYCSVGERSSRVARRVKEAAQKSQITISAYNLEEGIFGWHNDRRRLTRNGEVTDMVHPYDDKWGRLVERQDKVSYGAK